VSKKISSFSKSQSCARVRPRESSNCQEQRVSLDSCKPVLRYTGTSVFRPGAHAHIPYKQSTLQWKICILSNKPKQGNEYMSQQLRDSGLQDCNLCLLHQVAGSMPHTFADFGWAFFLWPGCLGDCFLPGSRNNNLSTLRMSLIAWRIAPPNGNF
jgi:hypothetical protein